VVGMMRVALSVFQSFAVWEDTNKLQDVPVDVRIRNCPGKRCRLLPYPDFQDMTMRVAGLMSERSMERAKQSSLATADVGHCTMPDV